MEDSTNQNKTKEGYLMDFWIYLTGAVPIRRNNYD